jgi:hypothetical protein
MTFLVFAFLPSSVFGQLSVEGTEGSWLITPFFPPLNNTVLTGVCNGFSNGPQFRYESDASGFIDVGLNGNGDYVIENNDIQSFTLTQMGNTGIGTTNPSAKLHVNGTVRLENLPYYFGTLPSVIYDPTTGDLYQQGTSLSNPNNEIIENLQRENEDLKTRLMALEESLQLVEQILNVSKNQVTILPTTAKLKQNQPNPFNGQTTINYFLPESTQKAQLQINDINGKILKVETITSTGHGQLNFDAKALPQGTYSYSLLVDGQLVETKQMILVK